VTGSPDEQTNLQTARLVDAGGNTISDPERAVSGEIREHEGRTRRTWFLMKEVELHWLPVSESAFLLWVLVALVVAWVGVAVALRFF
jgi:hypothetical protein